MSNNPVGISSTSIGHTFRLVRFAGSISVEVQPEGVPTIDVKITGDAARAARVLVEACGDGSVSMTDNGGGFTSGNISGGGNQYINNISGCTIGTMIVTGVNNVGIDMTGDGIKINGVNIAGAAPISAVVRVPRGTTLLFDDLHHNATIGDVDGRLTVQAFGDAELTVGRVKSARLEVTGDCLVRVSSVLESLTVEMKGDCRVKVKDGSVVDLKVETIGCGRFTYGGTSVHGRLDQTGDGCISLKQRPTGSLVKKSIGSGEIEID
jgi:hypothetical protein